MLEPSERIRLIKEIVRRLQEEEWPLIDVTLRQFSLPWTDDWRGDKDTYVIQMIEKAGDEVLMTLGRHVGYEAEKCPARVDPPFWRSGYLRLFICHLATFRGEAAALQEQLLLYGVSSFVAHNDIEPSAEWQNEIETALATADALIALMRPGFHASSWTDQEIGYAMGRSLAAFSVRLGEDPYGFIARFQAFDGNNKEPSALAREIFDVFRKHKQTRRRVAEALAVQLENSESFAAAKRNIGLLEEATFWQASFNERLRSVAQSNGQVAEAWGVPARIDRLIDKWQEGSV